MAVGSSQPSRKDSEDLLTARGGNLTDVSVTSTVGSVVDDSTKKKRMALLEDIALMIAAVSCFNDSLQFHNSYQSARKHGGYYFYIGLLFCEIFIVVPVLSILLHCANYTVSGISKFPQLYGKVFGFVSVGLVVVSMLNQSIAIASVSSNIAWGFQIRNGFDEITECVPLTEKELANPGSNFFATYCTSISKYKACEESKLGRFWTRLDQTQGSCTWQAPDSLLVPATSTYMARHFEKEEKNHKEDQPKHEPIKVFPTGYLVAFALSWLFLVLFSAGLTFAGVKWYSLVISGISFVSFILLMIIAVHLMSVGNIDEGHERFLKLTQVPHVVKTATVGPLAWCIIDSILFRFPVITLLSFRNKPFNPFHFSVGVAFADCFLKCLYFYISCSASGVFNRLSYTSSYSYNNGETYIFNQLIMTEMYALVSSIHWNRLYIVALVFVDIPRVSVPFVLCHAVVRDHFPKKNKWCVLSLSVAILVAFQLAMFFYFWLSDTPMDILNCMCGFYGLILVGLVMLTTVVVYGPVEFMLDIHSMSEEWRIKRFWRRLMVPFCVWMANNMLIPILFFLSIPRVTDAILFVNLQRATGAALNVLVMSIPGILMTGYFIFDLGSTIARKKFSIRLFLPQPEHPSYARVVTATFKKKREEKDEGGKGKKREDSENPTRKETK